MKIIRANHLGMCFGVRDAIHLAFHQTQPITILGDLVHNENVLHHLQLHGVKIKHEAAEVGTESVMVTAHGASRRVKEDLNKRGHNVIEATCPLVHQAHQAIQQLVRTGFHPVVIGQKNHVEVRGLTGDLDIFDVVLSEMDIARLPSRPRFGVVAQTTQPIDRVRHIVRLLRHRFPESEIKFVDTVCQPTKQRQDSAVILAKQSHMVIVVGGSHSNNTRELANTCRRYCPRVYHVQGPKDLCPDWFRATNIVGLTAGTSTPDEVIDAVEKRLHEIASVFLSEAAMASSLFAKASRDTGR